MKRNRSFGQFLTAKMDERGFKSDEQLARKAMLIQKQLSERINIQRRTINNWRNDKAKPRSTEDPQFKLVALALGLCDQEMAYITHLINETPIHDTNTNSKNNSTAIQSPALRKKISVQSSLQISLSLASIVIILGFSYFGPKSQHEVSYFETIPPTQLRVTSTGFVLPQSDTEVVNERQLETLSGWELYVARNEIFARNGRPFVKRSSICLQYHFDSWSKSKGNQSGWYKKRSGDIKLSDLEYRNAEIIRNYECNVRGGQYKCSGQLRHCP